MMSKKHFRLLAYRLSECEPAIVDSPAFRMWADTTRAVADVCECFNPNFSRSTFLSACHRDYWESHKKPI